MNMTLDLDDERREVGPSGAHRVLAGRYLVRVAATNTSGGAARTIIMLP